MVYQQVSCEMDVLLLSGGDRRLPGLRPFPGNAVQIVDRGGV